MRIAIIGNNDGPERLAAALADGSHEVVLVGLQKGARTREQSTVPDEQSLEQAITGLKVDLIINCFANFRYRYLHQTYSILNVHLAPLPRYRGRHPLQWALINGESTFGATIHTITDDYDAGPIYWRGELPVQNGWSARQLREAMLQLVETNITGVLDAYPTADPIPNNPAEATYVTRRNPEDSMIGDWSDRDKVYRTVHALREDEHPAFARTTGTEKVVFTGAQPGTRRFVGFVTGTVVGKTGQQIEVVCEDGRTLFLEVSPDSPHLPSTNDNLIAW
ncbi:formyltransferase family protein [Neolewinella antarctica]|uniref:Methionyl-tRNA formyltransferase n=1 Tax=Neolewinella antarctica TaxID=442734 RepID=A0ABX0XA56_9BACT|nr:formyltransferase family protein [Neolewinella antarctica]NJC26141.1 methionyl-tRNA formyltransferase [Neolewinella antarctica]